MASLEDKLLGEKLESYCSSSEDEADEGRNRQGAEGFTNADVCPPAPPAGGYRYNTGSVNTGPKGVVEDWQRFKKMQAEKRIEDEKKLTSLAKKLTMTVETAEQAELRKQEEEFNAELAELESDEFLQQYQKQRLAEMMRQCGNNKQFGHVFHLRSREEFLQCIESENKHITIVIHIYDRSERACITLNDCLDKLAVEYTGVKWAKICSSVAGMSKEFKERGVPALLVYKAQDLIGNFVRLTEDLSDDFYPSDVESFLLENGVLLDKTLYN